jgi:hypothetical protein
VGQVAGKGRRKRAAAAYFYEYYALASVANQGFYTIIDLSLFGVIY